MINRYRVLMTYMDGEGEFHRQVIRGSDAEYRTLVASKAYIDRLIRMHAELGLKVVDLQIMEEVAVDIPGYSFQIIAEEEEVLSKIA